METGNMTALGAIIVISLGLLEIVKMMVGRFVPKFSTNKNEKCAFIVGKKLDKIADDTEKLYELHNVKDRDGVPVWYVRHSIDDSLKSIDGTLRSLNSTVGNLNNLLERMDSKKGK